MILSFVKCQKKITKIMKCIPGDIYVTDIEALQKYRMQQKQASILYKQ